MTGFEHSGRRTALILALAVLSSPLLGGCALLVGGAMAGTAMVVADRRTSGTQVEDQAIELKAVSRVRETLGDKGHVNVTSYNKLVLLTGEVPNDADKPALEQAIARIENVRSVVNELAVMPSSSIGNRSNDAFVTSKVRASIVDAKDLITGAFKVVTERGTVYLMGRVTEREANRVADVARGVSGVQKVVRVFEIVTEGELAGTQPSPAPAK